MHFITRAINLSSKINIYSIYAAHNLLQAHYIILTKFIKYELMLSSMGEKHSFINSKNARN